jgi:hypothetical protein
MTMTAARLFRIYPGLYATEDGVWEVMLQRDQGGPKGGWRELWYARTIDGGHASPLLPPTRRLRDMRARLAAIPDPQTTIFDIDGV